MPPTKKAASKANRAMSDDHKAALSVGRAEGRAVRSYLEALETNRPKRGRKRTAESVSAQLERIEGEIAMAAPLQRLGLIQQRLDLQSELAAFDDAVDMSGLEEAFIANVKGYSERKGISYSAWREIGISPAVLTAAGIKRSQ